MLESANLLRQASSKRKQAGKGKVFTERDEVRLVVARQPFPDHHGYTTRELQHVLETASRLGATPVTTPKDAQRLPPALAAQVRVVGARLVWDDEAAIERLLGRK